MLRSTCWDWNHDPLSFHHNQWQLVSTIFVKTTAFLNLTNLWHRFSASFVPWVFGYYQFFPNGSFVVRNKCSVFDWEWLFQITIHLLTCNEHSLQTLHTVEVGLFVSWVTESEISRIKKSTQSTTQQFSRETFVNFTLHFTFFLHFG